MKKITYILLVLTLTLGMLFTLSSCIDGGSYTEWETTEDGDITNGTKTYSYYGEVYHNTRMDGFNVFSYYNDVYINGEDYWIYSAKPDCEVIYICRAWSMDDYTEYAYATESGKKILDEFFAGEADTIRLIGNIADENNMTAANITRTLYGELVAMTGNTLSVSVKDLEDEKRYDIIYFDDEGYLTNCHGAIYIIDEKYYFVDYYKLDNSYFDSDGFFSYRSGTVTLTEASKELSEGLDEALNRSYSYEYSYVSESPIY